MKSVCFVGASTTEGLGDEAGQGWVGRLATLCADEGAPILFHNLGVKGQTLKEITARAAAQCRSCLSHKKDRLIVFGCGLNDVARLENGTPRSTKRIIERRFRELLGELGEIAPLIVVGPPPVLESKMPIFSGKHGVSLDFRNEDAAEVSRLYAAITGELGIPYLEVYASLLENADYMAGLEANDGLHTNGQGYQRLAEIVAAWPVWQERNRLS